MVFHKSHLADVRCTCMNISTFSSTFLLYNLLQRLPKDVRFSYSEYVLYLYAIPGVTELLKKLTCSSIKYMYQRIVSVLYHKFIANSMKFKIYSIHTVYSIIQYTYTN